MENMKASDFGDGELPQRINRATNQANGPPTVEKQLANETTSPLYLSYNREHKCRRQGFQIQQLTTKIRTVNRREQKQNHAS
jgi:hypothetical protein